MDDEQAKNIRDLLSSIVEFFDDKRADLGAVKFYEMLAAKLSRIVGKDEPWSWRYVQGVHAGTVAPSAKFSAAVKALGAALDEVPVVLTYTVQVQVFARPGSVTPGSVVLGQSKPCARPGCKVIFVPNVPWRKYCSTECCVLAQKEG